LLLVRLLPAHLPCSSPPLLYHPPNCLAAEAPVIVWEQDGAVHAALISMNFTSPAPLNDATAACRTVRTRLPAKLRKGASVTATTFTYLFDPRKPAKKGE